MHAIFFNPPIEKNFLGFQFNEVYREGVYNHFFKNKKGTVVDVGANIGVTTYYFSMNAEKVHSIEPSFEHFGVLKHMVEFNKLNNVELHKKAIWMKDGRAKFFKNSENKTMYSLHGAVKDVAGKIEDVEMVTIDKFYKDNNITHCDFLKIDVEGSEFEILGHDGFREIAKITDTVFLEWHKWAQRNPAQLEQVLKQNGYKIMKPTSNTDLIVGTKL